jgi:hypothetical protein
MAVESGKHHSNTKPERKPKVASLFLAQRRGGAEENFDVASAPPRLCARKLARHKVCFGF